jgi:signal transduction histidine kinase
VSTIVLGETRTLALATLGAMTSRVAHEVKNVLGGIELYASMLAEQCAREDDLAPLASRLLAGVKQLHVVAGNLLSVSRRPTIEPVAVDAARVVVETVDSVTLAVRGSGIRLRHVIGTEKAWVQGDAERLRQALLNLVLNAMQAMPNGGTLTIRTRLRADHVEITVRDTGIGMDTATLRRATEPFFTTRANGTGLGLAIVREVTEAHGALLHLRSRPRRGTTARMVIPLAPGDLGRPSMNAPLDGTGPPGPRA